MKFNYFIGIDVSKKTLDFYVLKNNQLVFHLETENSQKGIQGFIRELKKHSEFSYESAVFCMEHTGIYNNFLLDYLFKKQAKVCLESAIHIKQSSGLQRGKNDKVDSMRIALYAYKNREELKFWEPKREVISQLKHLSVLRSRLINSRKQLTTSLKESSQFIDAKTNNMALKYCKTSILALEKDIQQVEKKINQIIVNDPRLNQLFEIITSIQGVGSVTATEVIITTNEFKDIKDPKKYACYAGVAPFEHSSGSSIRGKVRVSKMANKSVKSILHMAALTSIIYNEELKQFYQRKVAEGKNKMSIINAVRNKLISRIFSCVNQNRKYEKIYTNVLA